MPILVSSTYVHGYGKSITTVETALNLNSMNNTQDVFVVKYSTLGKALWSARIASPAVDIGYGITTDSGGNVYVTGQGGSASVVTAFNSDGTPFGTTTFANAGNVDVFIVKYNTSGFAQWVARIASTAQDISYGIAADSDGNVYITGQGGSAAVVTAYNSNGTAFGTTIANAGNNDVFIVKYNTSGTVQWVARIASTAIDIGYAIATDSSGNVYVTGEGGSGVVVTAYNSDGTAFGTTIANAGSNDTFVVKYNTSGFVQWVARVASTGADRGYGIATDSGGNVYVTGQCGSSVIVTAYNSDGTAFGTTIPSAGSSDVFVVKYNTSGFVQWIARIATNGQDIGYDITADSGGNVYVTGQGGNAAPITAYNSNGTAFGTTLANIGNTDVFIVKYNTSGFVQWATRVASTIVDIGYGIAADSGGNVYVTGQGGNGVDITAYNSDGTAFGTTLTNAGNNDAFLVKYNTSGFVQWLTRIASNGVDISRSISVDSNSNVYITGEFLGVQTSIYGQALSLFGSIPNVGFEDVFIVKYNTSGNPQWIARIVSTASDSGYDIATDSGGNLYVIGQGGSAVVVTAYNSDGTAFATTIPTAGNSEAFIVKYNTSGFVQWVTRISSTAIDIGFAITADPSDNIYVTGQGGSGVVVTAYNSNGTAFGTTIANAGSNDAFIVKYDTSGFVQWVTRVASTAADIGYAITTDSGGNVYLTGQGGSAAVVTAYNSNATTFGTTLANAGSNDAFIVKYNTSGFAQWIARIASTAVDIGFAITADPSGNVYVTGEGGSGVVVTAYNSDGTAFGTTLANGGGTDAFIVKYDTSGFVQWVTRVASLVTDKGLAVVTDSSGNLFVTGQGGSGAPVTVYNSDGTAFGTILAGAGGGDAFIVKYNTSGFVQWVTRIASSGTDTGYGIATDSSGNLYVTMSNGNSVPSVTVFHSNTDRFATVLGSCAIVKYNTNGFAQWAQIIRGTNFGVDTRGISTDSFGNVAIISKSTVNGDGVNVYNADSTPYRVITAIGFSGVYLVKYSSTASPLWVGRIETTGSDLGYAIATDSSGNVYVTGEGGVGLPVTAYNSDGTAFGTTLPNRVGGDVFIVKYNTSGVVQWVAQVASTAQDRGYSITTDSSGNVYVTGEGGSGTVTAYNSNGTAFGTTLANAGTGDAFIVKYDTNGSVQWVARVASTAADIGYGIVTDSTGNVYVTGQGGTGAVVTAYNSNGTAFGTTLANAGGTDAFIVKYDTNGSVQWVARVASTGADIGLAIATDSTGNVYVTGQGGSAIVTAYNSNGTAFGTTLANAGAGDTFIVKYDTNGTVQWVTRIASTSADKGFAVATDPGGNVYVTGQAGTTFTAYNSDGTAFGTGIVGNAFIVKYNTSGFVQWATHISSALIVYSVATDSGGNVYVTGRGNGVVTANNSDGTAFGSAVLPVFSPFDLIFIVKYNTTGRVQWISIADGGGTGGEEGRGIALDTSANIYVTGSFTGSSLVPYSA